MRTTGRRIAATIVAMLLAATPVVAEDALHFDEYQGNVVMLDFWASWCGPCKRSFAWMNDMQLKYADDGLIIVGVNVDNDLAAAREFLEENPATFKIAYDDTRQLAHKFDVEAMPSSFLIDREGNLVESHLGFKTNDTEAYEAAIVSALENMQ